MGETVMSISIYTQYMENYGVEEGANYWKFKWGDKYIVEGTDDRPANAVATVMHHLARYNTDPNYSIEYVHRWIHTAEEYRVEGEDYVEQATVLQYKRYSNDDDLDGSGVRVPVPV